MISKSFTFNKSVKQGDELSATLFSIALHYSIKDEDQRGTVLNKTSQKCASAVDTVIMGRSIQRPVEVYKELNKKSAGMGPNVNISKTKINADTCIREEKKSVAV